MTERHPNSHTRQPRDEALRHLLGRQGDEGHGVAQRRQQIEVARLQTAEHAPIMHAGLVRGQKRSLVVKPDHARIDPHGGLYGVARCPHLFGRVAEQCRQHRGRAEPPVRRCDGGNSARARVVVEQHVCAAVHLSVDEPGNQPGARRQTAVGYRRRQLVPAHDGADARVFDYHRAIAAQHRAVEDVVGGNRELHIEINTLYLC